MLLKYLQLENIRSYEAQRIQFLPGKTLLAGDIGSGKTTILLAIEFALFGVLRGMTSGESLLRKGKNSGSVELSFGLDGKEYVIKRALKRLKDGVQQETGFLTENGVQKNLSTIELKSEILDILGYPKELLTKSKSLIFRYTVFTPQEEMKQILLESPEERLEVLRKVFGIDKYQRIQNNAQIYIRMLNEKNKILEDRTRNMGKQQDELKELLALVEQKKKEKEEFLLLANATRNRTTIARQQLELANKSLMDFLELKRQIAVAEAQLSAILDRRKRTTEQMTRLEQEIVLLKLEIEKIPDDLIHGKVLKLEEELNMIDEQAKITAEGKKLSELVIKSEEIKKKVMSLTHCPMCEQNVDGSHKEKITQQENQKIKEYMAQIKAIEPQIVVLVEKRGILRAELEELKLLEKKHAVAKVKRELLQKRQIELIELQGVMEDSKKEVGILNMQKIKLQEGYQKLLAAEETSKRVQEQWELSQKQQHQVELRLATSTKEFDMIMTQKKRLEEDIAKLQQDQAQLENVKKMKMWMQEHFVPLIALIEKHVFLTVYEKFNKLFTEWFSMLMEDELLLARLDEGFTPVVVQNGYDVEFTSLSGGEKTSLALAYRLALNTVINDLMNSVKTRHLLILDEPTDGFSEQQLDKMGDVLRKLDIKQIIVVSHETKVESFVDHITYITKKDHVSVLAADEIVSQG